MRIFTTNREIKQILLCKLHSSIQLFNIGYTFLLSLQEEISVTSSNYSLTLSKHDTILFYPEESFSLTGSSDSYLLIITLDPLYFNHCFHQKHPYTIFSSCDPDKNVHKNIIHHLASMAIAYYTDTQNNDNYLLAQVYQLLHCMQPRIVEQTQENTADHLLVKQQKKIDKIHRYIDDNYTKQITLQELADYMAFSPQYLASFMKKYLHMTFYGYLNSIRLEAATKLLKFTDESLHKLSLTSGFPNPSAFLKQFTEKNAMDPLDFRMEFQQKKEQTHIPIECQVHNFTLIKGLLTEQSLIHNTTMTPVESSVSESVYCNVLKYKPFSPSWRKLINLGDAANFENPSFRQHLFSLQSEIGFEYGRIQNIMSLISNCIVTGYMESNMTNIFRIIDYLRSLNLKPLFDIGGKPAHIYMNNLIGDKLKYPVRSNYFEEVLKPLLPLFLKSCINHYGFHIVSQWKFEFWQEYNDNMTVLESPQSYVNRFLYVYSTIKELLPNTNVGAPGFNTYADITHFKNTLLQMEKQHIKPDFVSIYVYPYQHSADMDANIIVGRLSLAPDKDVYKNRIDQCYYAMKDIWAQPPDLYITEYGTHIVSNNYINDAAYPALLIIRESLNNYPHTQAMGYWLLSDYSLHFKYSSNILFGGNGIISRDGIRKPGFFAYRFLKSLGNRIIARGEHYIVTSSSKFNYQILVYYYGYFNEDYCRHQKDFLLLKYPGSPFELLKPLDIEITLEHVERGTYHLNQWVLSPNQGNLLLEWKKINNKEHLTAPEIDYLKNKSTPALNTETRKTDGTLILTTKLAMHEIVLYEIDYLS